MAEIAQDRLCLNCLDAEIMGKPYSVYVCWECYFLERCECGYVRHSPACQSEHSDGYRDHSEAETTNND